MKSLKWATLAFILYTGLLILTGIGPSAGEIPLALQVITFLLFGGVIASTIVAAIKT